MHNHELETIVQTPACRIDRCSCGSFHVVLPHMSFKLCSSAFFDLSRATQFASARLLAAEEQAN